MVCGRGCNPARVPGPDCDNKPTIYGNPGKLDPTGGKGTTMENPWCDNCGEERSVYSYRDTVIGTDEEVVVYVCADCGIELYQASVGKDNPIYLASLYEHNTHLVTFDIKKAANG